MKPKFSPAPWTDNPGARSGYDWAKIMAGRAHIATINHWSPDVNDANMCLITSSPDLYAALDACPVIRIGETLEEFKTRFSAWHRELRVPALKKALGE